ncbi:unnamed protein product [Lampetra fluviatilis]
MSIERAGRNFSLNLHGPCGQPFRKPLAFRQKLPIKLSSRARLELSSVQAPRAPPILPRPRRVTGGRALGSERRRAAPASALSAAVPDERISLPRLEIERNGAGRVESLQA